MDSDSSFHYPFSSSDDEDELNNMQNGFPLKELQSDDGSIASSGTNGSATTTDPPQPPKALQLKKQQCCDLLLHAVVEPSKWASKLCRVW